MESVWLPYCFSAETLGLSLSGTGLAQGRFLLSDCSRSVGIDKSACAECSRSIELVRRSDPGSIPEPIRDRSAKPTTSDGRLTKNHSAKPITPTINWGHKHQDASRSATEVHFMTSKRHVWPSLRVSANTQSLTEWLLISNKLIIVIALHVNTSSAP